ncbi:hypothetical protein [Shimia sp. MMG029]|uniref:hypothetical protein n=1 Tax=Shimia sp. MMG029 TaxID=3021978 RepID=UPI0022FEBA6A|nr:hypothetical protein [Shimia sp. MMG029]MDA5556184.1 hypothetical protein [Shimia sp. MMG029]
MLKLNEQGSLIERFGAATPDYVVHAKLTSEKQAKEHDDDLAGQKSGNRENMLLSSAAATKDAQDTRTDKAEQESKRQYDDAMFMALLNNGGLDSHVAGNTFGGMSDEEVLDVVAEIEAETGKNFEDYAKDILGDNMPERVSGESDADYQRRVLIAVGEEVLEEDGITFKEGYENDPIARIIRRSEVYQDALDFNKNMNAEVSATATVSEEHNYAVEAESNKGYYSSEALGNGLENEELSRVASNVQDEKRDSGLDTLSDNSSGFGAALALASDTFNGEFENAAAQPLDTETVSPGSAPDTTPALQS